MRKLVEKIESNERSLFVERDGSEAITKSFIMCFRFDRRQAYFSWKEIIFMKSSDLWPETITQSIKIVVKLIL